MICKNLKKKKYYPTSQLLHSHGGFTDVVNTVCTQSPLQLLYPAVRVTGCQGQGQGRDVVAVQKNNSGAIKQVSTDTVNSQLRRRLVNAD
jgi:hypothetical protein